MREFLLFCGLINIASSFHDEISDYLYSNEEGLIRDSLNLVLHRYGNVSRTDLDYIDGRSVVRAGGQLKGKECKHGEEVKVECNRCLCKEGNIYGCTLRGCIDNPEQVKLRVPTTSARCDKFGSWVPLGPSDCSNCYCIGNNLAICLLDLCEDKRLPLKKRIAPPRPKNCVPGSGMLEGRCTKCLCTKRRRWVCKKELECNEPLNHGTCESGLVFYKVTMKSCTTCTCVNGIWQCIEKPGSCHEGQMLKLSNLQCTPEDVYVSPKESCGVCVCDPRRQPICFGDSTCNLKKALKGRMMCNIPQCRNHCYKLKKVGRCTTRGKCVCL